MVQWQCREWEQSLCSIESFRDPGWQRSSYLWCPTGIDIQPVERERIEDMQEVSFSSLQVLSPILFFWLGSDEYDPVEMQRGPETWWAATSQWPLSGQLVTGTSSEVTFSGQALPPRSLYWELHEGRDSLFHNLSWRPSTVNVWMNNQPPLDHRLYLGHDVRHRACHGVNT